MIFLRSSCERYTNDVDRALVPDVLIDPFGRSINRQSRAKPKLAVRRPNGSIGVERAHQVPAAWASSLVEKNYLDTAIQGRARLADSTHSMTKGAASNFSFIEPMKALPVRDLPACDWVYEMKFDGYRALAFETGKEMRLISRNQG